MEQPHDGADSTQDFGEHPSRRLARVAETREVCLPGNRIDGSARGQCVVGRTVFSFSLTSATSAAGEMGLTT